MLDCNFMEWDGPVPAASKGLGVPYLTYGSGRMGASVTHGGGLHQVSYYGNGPELASPIFFEADAASSYTKLFRFQLVADGTSYHLELHGTQHFPFGYASHFTISHLQVKVRHHLTLLNNAFISTLEVLDNPQSLSLSI